MVLVCRYSYNPWGACPGSRWYAMLCAQMCPSAYQNLIGFTEKYCKIMVLVCTYAYNPWGEAVLVVAGMPWYAPKGVCLHTKI